MKVIVINVAVVIATAIVCIFGGWWGLFILLAIHWEDDKPLDE